jgi:hypothetical protein
MPTDLERRLLSTLIHDFELRQLRRLVMHVAETHLELVGKEALRIKEENKGIVIGRRSAAIPPIAPRISPSRPAIVLSEDSDTQSTYIHIGKGIELIHT